jgi:hypothetical protein
VSRALVPELVRGAGGAAVARGAARVVPFVGALDAITRLGGALREALEVQERARTERAEIAARRDVALAAISAWHTTVSAQLQQALRERDALREALLPLVHDAAKAGDRDTLGVLLDALQRMLDTPMLAGAPPLPPLLAGPGAADPRPA